jgi:RNA polymerase sigma-70 factor (ECF subfamily)
MMMSAMEGEPGPPFISDEPTVELIVRARVGDQRALEALVERCIPSLRQWAHGRLPTSARGSIDTSDLVQDAVMHALRRLDAFEPRHVGAMQAYLRRSVTNRIIDEVRKVKRHPAAAVLDDDQPAQDLSPLEEAMKAETYDRYRAGLRMLKPLHRHIVVARIEMQWSIARIAKEFGYTSVDAARMAVTRAVKHLKAYTQEPPVSV